VATIDSEAAIVLNQIPESGTTLTLLADATNFVPERVEAAVQRLLSLGLVEVTGETIGITPFAHKARSLFTIVA
jgi:hypothetical protein